MRLMCLSVDLMKTPPASPKSRATHEQLRAFISAWGETTHEQPMQDGGVSIGHTVRWSGGEHPCETSLWHNGLILGLDANPSAEFMTAILLWFSSKFDPGSDLRLVWESGDEFLPIEPANLYSELVKAISVNGLGQP